MSHDDGLLSTLKNEYDDQGSNTPYTILACSDLAFPESLPTSSFHSWVSVEPDGRPIYLCMWEDCYASVETEQQFRLHFENHLSTLADTASHIGISCPIVGCSFHTQSTSILRSHITVHYHHAHQQMQGLEYVLSRQDVAVSSLRKCGFPPVLQADYDGLNIQCAWELCRGDFIDANEFFNHVLCHVEICQPEFKNNKFRCGWNECGKEFKDRGDLKKHVAGHVNLKRCACPFCGNYMSSLDKLGEHLKRRLPEERLIHKCPRCDSGFADETILYKHMYHHLHSSGSQCGYCGALFRSPYEVERHKSHHHDEGRERDYACLEQNCGKSFFSQQELDQHQRIHKPPELQCRDCGEKFRFSTQLNRHRKVAHATENVVVRKKYLCHVCEDLFSRGDKLTKHLKARHSFPIPEGFSQYRYKKCGDGFFRLQTNKLLRSNVGSSSRQN